MSRRNPFVMLSVELAGALPSEADRPVWMSRKTHADLTAALARLRSEVNAVATSEEYDVATAAVTLGVSASSVAKLRRGS